MKAFKKHQTMPVNGTDSRLEGLAFSSKSINGFALQAIASPGSYGCHGRFLIFRKALVMVNHNLTSLT